MKDLIDRQAAIDVLEYLTDFVKDNNYENGETLLFQESAIEQINALPSAQPERERGEWYKPKEYPRDSYRYICSNCQDVAYYVTGNNGKKQKEDKPKCGYRYCPNCGARMTERRTDEQTVSE